MFKLVLLSKPCRPVLNRRITPRLLKCLYFSSKPSESDNDDKPVKYSSSPAAKWKAQTSVRGPQPRKTAPWYEPYVIIISVSVFMIYFCILREENDVDKEFDKTLYERIAGLEEVQLRLSLDYNKEHNLPTADLEKRLRELESKKESPT